ncbi:Repeat domain in Vibrio, Colwellia, Bradyrhizobium and Shewanella [uncultured archaeon]|nr:Repeat domain in Vibrio, Colwellia, Bradyrhizobium and Shewanella [uncultured archaeon]
MKKVILSMIIVLIVSMSSIGLTGAFSFSNNTESNASTEVMSNGYGLQWMMEYGNSPWTDARFQGPQPIGDSDNDGKNELLISGRDCTVRIMKWVENDQTYSQVYALHPPLYPLVQCDAGGMAIGDVTNDGKNEIAATWYTAVYRYIAFKYWMIGVNPWIFFNGGGSADCLIGDCDNDGKNELILSGGGDRQSSSPVGEITVFKWNGLYLQRVAEWNDRNVYGYVFMAGLGDVDADGENEIVCAYENKVMVLNWDAQNKEFVPTKIQRPLPLMDSPFGVVCKDCDNDGKAEILLSYENPRITIFKWNGTGYTTQFDITWPDGDPVIEGIDVGDTDNDGLNEVCAGAGVTHILQWNGTTYVEEALLPTFGWMAVVCIGDCDNDGKNEINAGNVDVASGQQFTEWVFKYGWDT